MELIYSAATRFRTVLVVSALASLFLAATCVADERSEIPDTAAREAVAPKLREIYRDAFQTATTSEARALFVEQLLGDAAGIADDAAARYVVFEWAGRQAAEAADPALLRKVLAATVAAFEIDETAWYLTALGDVPDKLREADACRRLAEDALSIIDGAIATERYDAADRLLVAAAKLQVKARDLQLSRAVGERRTRLGMERRSWDLAEKAAATLAQNSDDPTANLARGRYLCFSRGDWDGGLPLLAKGNDAVLSPLAKQTLDAKRDTATAQAALAALWWDAASRSRASFERYRDLLRGVRYWYALAQPGLTGVDGKLAESRLAEAEKVLGPMTVAAVATATKPTTVKPLGESEVLDASKLPPTFALPLGNNVALVLRLIPAGTFTMGSPPEEPGRNVNEAQYEVTISRPFYMGQFEVTREQWKAVTGQNAPQYPTQLKRPVNNVTWNDAVDFCRRLNAALAGRPRLEGYAFRLPTEAEWEYACRAGTTTATHYGDQLSSLQAWFDGGKPYNGAPLGPKPAQNEVRDVGSFKPNAWGLYDMHGNAWEWCQDWYATHDSGPVTDPVGPSVGTHRVNRGGGYSSAGVNCRSARRDGEPPNRAHTFRGFRIVYGPMLEISPAN